jgi:hypothetical protein
MDTTCEYCNGVYSNKYALKRHINTSKKCMDLRNIAIQYDYICEHCNYSTNRKSHYDTHLKNCSKLKEYTNNLIAKQKSEIETLKSNLDYAKELVNIHINKPTTTSTVNNIKNDNSVNNNNKVSNRLNIQVIHDVYRQIMSPIEELEKKLPEYMDKNFTEKHLKRGVNGVAEISSELLYGDAIYYINTDKTGNNFCYKDRHNNILQDDNARYLTDITMDAVEKVATKIASEKIKDICEQSKELIGDERKELDNERNCIKKGLSFIKNIKTDNKLFRKYIADKGYFSEKTISQYADNPQLLIEMIKKKNELFVGKIPLKSIMNQENAKQILSRLSTDGLKIIMADLNIFIQFIVKTFLCFDHILIYNYDKDNDEFIYYFENIVNDNENESIEYSNLEMSSDNGYRVYQFATQFSRRFMKENNCDEEYNNIRSTSEEEFISCLKRNILLKDLMSFL